MDFKLVSNYKPTGDQPKAIKYLSEGLLKGEENQILLGVTGSGKTFTVANVIEKINKPALIMAPNKTLAAQLYQEFKQLFPENAVEYFVSYYDYYQPEAYIPTSDTYIQKDSSINEMIERMRHSATRSVLTRDDVIVVASVSCIYGLGSPEDYLALRVEIKNGMELSREKLLSDLVAIQYERNDMDFHRGAFRVRGDRVEIFPAYEDSMGIRIEFFGDTVDNIVEIDPLRGTVRRKLKSTALFPATHYVTEKGTRKRAIETITKELKERIEFLRNENRLLEAQRIEERTDYDLEMIREIGYCNGIENYSAHLTGRAKGEAPPTLLEYFPDDFLTFIDESHIAIPQIRAMYKGDRSRKTTLVEFGFRLPTALDNRPLQFKEFTEKTSRVVYVSATPADYEIEKSHNTIVEQIVRPTGLLDPVITVRKAENQVDDLYDEISKRCAINERVLVTTLTKRMAEDLTDYYTDLGVKVKYLHSDVKTLERIEIIQELRQGVFDVLVGINLLREGLDIPEVSLVAILDTDKEGFLRSQRSLVQICGRAARNSKGKVIMYADKITASMDYAIRETKRRRKIQENYNRKHKITPTTIQKEIISSVFDINTKDFELDKTSTGISETIKDYETPGNLPEIIKNLEIEMEKAALDLAFEKAAELRDKIKELKKISGL
ncbi:MAG: excinuclease ABC subunit UvrB [Desulfobacterales bacterium]|nr:excinuclease ABC subunit UvrB [Desulfobacterales bacterium]MCP4163208.1 excinuclease ABC subunit UvrB [Deltaproteobacteria bacterium]